MPFIVVKCQQLLNREIIMTSKASVRPVLSCLLMTVSKNNYKQVKREASDIHKSKSFFSV